MMDEVVKKIVDALLENGLIAEAFEFTSSRTDMELEYEGCRYILSVEEAGQD